MNTSKPLEIAVAHAESWLEGLATRGVAPNATRARLLEMLGGPVPDGPADGAAVVDELARAAEPGLMATSSPRFFGFVIGGVLPVALAADWLTGAWDQNDGLHAVAPAASVAEDVAGTWLKQLLGLPPHASFGFVTGGQMANFTALAAARHHVLARAGWDVTAHGLTGAPHVRVLTGAEHHVTIPRALRWLGIGTDALEVLATDDEGRMRPAELERALAARGGDAVIVCTQVGNVNTGAIDPVGDICGIAHERGAWVHVDGAFGLWAAAAPSLRPLVAGIETADSWATDAHKWLNVPYDSGLAFCAHPEAHRASMSVHASYLVHAETDERDPMDWNPEFSRRARGFPVYAAIRSLGRTGIAEIVERCCANARRFAEGLRRVPGIAVLNDVVLNQVLVRFGDDDDITRRVIRRIQDDGTCWMGGSVWHGKAVMRISVSNWATTPADVDTSVAAVVAAASSR